jgi:tRNA dimethylallyltransferase
MRGFEREHKPPESGSQGPRLTAVFLFGPTAVGKTRSLNLLSERFPGLEVISADSVQVYRGLDIGSAKPSAEELRRIPHHNIDVVDPDQGYTVADFVRSAEHAISDIRSRGGLPVVSGGTAFYIKHLWFGLPESPPADPSIAAELAREAEIRGMEALRAELREVDPVSSERIAEADRYRILRALEVYRSSGRPLSSYPVPRRPRDDMQVLPLALKRDREDLYRRIDRRVEQMFADGLEAEVRDLIRGGCASRDPGMKAIGYREFFAEDALSILQSGQSLPPEIRTRIIGEIQQASRRYAKRQMTFFRSLPDVRWIDADTADFPDSAMSAIIESRL